MITQIDFNVLNYIQMHSNRFFDAFFALITRLGDGGIFWIVLAVALLFFKKTRKCSIMMMIALVLGLLTGNLLLKNLIARPRPFAQNPDMLNYLLISPPDGYSCPSGHTLASFECATVIFLNNKKWGIGALVLASLIGYSRMYLYVHFTTDVLFGLALGVGIGIAAYFIFKKFIENKLKLEKTR